MFERQKDIPQTRYVGLKKAPVEKSERRTQKCHHQIGWLALSVVSLLCLGACSSNFVVRHRSQLQSPIHVYVNWRLLCKLQPKQECRKNLKPGRYYFYAQVPGHANKRWASPQQPAPFSVDKRTVIDLHDPKPKRPSKATSPAPQSSLPRKTLRKLAHNTSSRKSNRR